jgi:hypothetical protein
MMTPRAALLVAAAMLAAVSGCAARARTDEPSVQERIRYYTARIEEEPRLYPAHAQLGSAYLERARETLDPASIAQARAALTRSLDIQENFAALKLMTALSNFTHRFRDAVGWGERAAAAVPADSEVTALRVESLIGLGESEAARALLDGVTGSGTPADFHLAAARGRLLAESGRSADAVAAYAEAATLAEAGGVDDLVAWAWVSAAGVWIDDGEAERATPYLADARRMIPNDRRFRIHQAELLAAQGGQAGALAIYEALVAKVLDPEVHRRAALLARDLGRTKAAEAHFAAAEKGFRRVLDAGEIYALEGLARLYAEHAVHLEEAAALSARNLTYKRDRSALATAAEVRAALAKLSSP